MHVHDFLMGFDKSTSKEKSTKVFAKQMSVSTYNIQYKHRRTINLGRVSSVVQSKKNICDWLAELVGTMCVTGCKIK